MAWAQTRMRTRTAAFVTAVLAVFFFTAVKQASAGTVATPNGVGVGKAVDGTVAGSPHHLGFAGLISVDLSGTPGWAYCIDINHGLQMNQPHDEGDWSESNVANLAKITRILQQHPADATQGGANSDEAAAVQASIWHFSDGFDLTAPASVVTLYQQIVADAQANPVSEPTTSLDISPSQQTGVAGAYLEVIVTTAAVGPVGLAVTPSGGAELVTCDAAHIPIGATISGPYPAHLCFHRSTAGGPVTVTATASASVAAGRVFLRDGSQKLVLAASRTVQTQASAAATWTEAPPVNHPPTVTLLCPDTGFVFGQAATFTVAGQDADNDTLSYAWQKNAVALPGTGSSISLTLVAGDTLSVTAADSHGASSAPATLSSSCGHAAPDAPPAPTVAPQATESPVAAPVAVVSPPTQTVTPPAPRNGVLGVKQHKARTHHQQAKAPKKATLHKKAAAKAHKAKHRTAPVALPHTL